jgi:hypothetical protein
MEKLTRKIGYVEVQLDHDILCFITAQDFMVNQTTRKANGSVAPFTMLARENSKFLENFTPKKNTLKRNV